MGFVLSRIQKAFPYIAGAMAVLILASLSVFRVFDLYEYQTYDWRLRLKPKPAVADEIVIVEIGDDTLEAIGRWPIDRDYHAILIDILKESGARMLGFDILLVEPTNNDANLLKSSQDFGQVYFANAYLSPHLQDGRLASDAVLAPLLRYFHPAAKAIAHVNAEVDADGKRRRFPPVVHHQNRMSYHMGFLMALDYLGISREDLRYDLKKGLKMGSFGTLPLDENGYALISFAGTWAETFRHVSYADILSSYAQEMRGNTPSLDLNQLKDKICFLGLTATATVDLNPIPLEPIYPQIGVHANVFNMVLNKAFLKRLSPWGNLAILFALMLIAMLLARIPKLVLSLMTAILIPAVFIVSSVILFSFANLWIDMILPMLTFGAIYLLGILRRGMFEKRKRELLETELTIASKIQRSFLPTNLPQTDRLDIAAFMQPAKHVGGDLYSVFKIDEDRMGVMLGDVSGKGPPAALFMAKTVSEFKFNSRGNLNAAEVLTNLNESLSADDTSGLFVTANYAVYDMQAERMILSNAGHMPVLRVKRSGEVSYLTPDGGMPLALMPGVEFMNLSITLEDGDIFVFYSDGVSEARNAAGQEFEMERLSQSVVRHRGGGAQEIQFRVLEDVQKFVGRASRHDDTTLVIVKIKKSQRLQ